MRRAGKNGRKSWRKINKKLNKVVTPSELLSYYKQLKYLDKEDVLFNRKNDVKVFGKFHFMVGESGLLSENNKFFDINAHLDNLSLSDKQKMEKNGGERVILMGKVGGRTKAMGLLNLYVKKIKFVNK